MPHHYKSMRRFDPYLLLIDTEEHLNSAYREIEGAKVELSVGFRLTKAFPELLS